jgi:hypothetical protein
MQTCLSHNLPKRGEFIFFYGDNFHLMAVIGLQIPADGATYRRLSNPDRSHIHHQKDRKIETSVWVVIMDLLQLRTIQ